MVGVGGLIFVVVEGIYIWVVVLMFVVFFGGWVLVDCFVYGDGSYLVMFLEGGEGCKVKVVWKIVLCVDLIVGVGGVVEVFDWNLGVYKWEKKMCVGMS